LQKEMLQRTLSNAVRKTNTFLYLIFLS